MLPGSPPMPWRSTLLAYVHELVQPPESPYTATAGWLEAHGRAEESAYVVPEFGAYPLMFHVPKLVYGWQFSPDMRREYPFLPAIHFKGAALPDYFVAFGPAVDGLRGFPPPNRWGGCRSPTSATWCLRFRSASF
jgi:hypothetical protein